MFNKCVAFMYEDAKYIVIKGISYLEDVYTGRNAVPVLDTMSSTGVSTAISRPWGVTSPFKIPELTDATISMSGDMFVIDAYLHVDGVLQKYHLDADTVEVYSEKAEVTVQEELPEPIVETIVVPTSAPLVANPALLIGKPKATGIRLNSTVVHVTKPTVTETPQLPIGRGIQVGIISNKPVMRTLKSAVPEEPVNVCDIPRKSLDNQPSYVYVVNDEVNKAIEKKEEEKKDPFNIKSLSGKDILKDVINEEVVEEEPVKSSALDNLTDEQRAVLELIPTTCFDFNISEFTNKEINVVELEQNGAMYCVMNTWHNVGDYYFIDVIPHMSRYFYKAGGEISTEIPASVCKAWAQEIAHE